jgi:hypothetical protein
LPVEEAAGKITPMDDEATRIVMTTLADIRTHIVAIRGWLLEEDDGEEEDSGL